MYVCMHYSGCFPFDWLKHLEQLQDDQFPAHSEFFNSLKQENVSAELYDEMKEICNSLQPRTMASFLAQYTNLDSEILQLVISDCIMMFLVSFFFQSLGELFKFWREQGFDPVSEAVSLPGLSAKLVHKMSAKRRGIIWMPSTRKQLELYDLFSRGMIGYAILCCVSCLFIRFSLSPGFRGPSIVWLRAACANVSRIRGNGEIVQSIVGMDANAFVINVLFIYRTLFLLILLAVCT